MSIYFPPVQIDPAGLGDESNSNFFGASQTEGPWLVNGALYVDSDASVPVRKRALD